VDTVGKPEFTTCEQQCAAGCAIYKKRPQQCREYICAYRGEWTPNDVSWRPDHLGVILDMHPGAMGGNPGLRLWQLRSERQLLEDPKIRQMVYGCARQLGLPVVARFGNIMNVSVHLIRELAWIRKKVEHVRPVVNSYLLTPDLIEDPEDFDRERVEPSEQEIERLRGQFGAQAFLDSMRKRRPSPEEVRSALARAMRECD